MDRRILKQGKNCRRIEDADNVAFLIDGDAYFQGLVSAISQAKDTLYIAAWDIDSRTHLLRTKNSPDKPVQLGAFLNDKVARTPGLQAYILCWDFAMIYALEREWLPLFRLGWKTHRRIHFHMDDEHPAGASHHQKFVVVDDAVAFSGGIDPTKNRWDLPEHRAEDPRRTDPNGRPYTPFHDVQMVVNGDAAAALGDLFRDRWLWATGERLRPVKVPGPIPWPQNTQPDMTQVQVAVSRTLPAYKGRVGVREVEALYTEAIASAKKYIYIENQYLTSTAIGDVLAQSLKQTKGPEIVIIQPQKSEGWLARSTMDALRIRLLKRLSEVDERNRLRVFCPVRGNDKYIYVHAKVMVVDDRLVIVGSANLNNRSMGLDSECDLSVEAFHNPAASKGIATFRNRLLAEHLGTSIEQVEKAVQETRSLIKPAQTLSEGARGLRPLKLDQKPPIDGASLVTDPSLLDPERPVKFDQMIDRFVDEQEGPSGQSHPIEIVVGLLVLSGMAAAWRWSPISEWVSIQKMALWADSLKQSPFALLGVTSAYVLGGLVMVPVTALVAVTAIVFAPFTGAVYALIGCQASAVVTYGVGAWLGKRAIRTITGPRINRLSSRLSRQGLLTMALVRNLPIAPFTIVNIVAGASRITFRDYFFGTALGMAPGILAVMVFTDRVIIALRDPHWGNISMAVAVALGLAIGVWWIRKRISGKKRN